MKYVKIALIALAPIVLAIGLYAFVTSGGPDLKSSSPFVDVRTGKIERLPLHSDRTRVIPAFAEDGERTLFPVIESPDGGWMIVERYQPVFTQRFGKQDGLRVDATSFAVLDD